MKEHFQKNRLHLVPISSPFRNPLKPKMIRFRPTVMFFSNETVSLVDLHSRINELQKYIRFSYGT